MPGASTMQELSLHQLFTDGILADIAADYRSEIPVNMGSLIIQTSV